VRSPRAGNGENRRAGNNWPGGAALPLLLGDSPEHVAQGGANGCEAASTLSDVEAQHSDAAI
jgi:hypothetical protein